MIDTAAAQHGNLGGWIENGEIDRRFERRKRRLVESVEDRRISQLDDRCFAHPAHVRRAGSIDPSRTRCVSRSCVSALGSSIAWHRCRPIAGCVRMCESKIPWSISRPPFCLSGSAFSAAKDCSSGASPAEASPPGCTSRSTRRNALLSRGEPVVSSSTWGGQEKVAEHPAPCDGSRRTPTSWSGLRATLPKSRPRSALHPCSRISSRPRYPTGSPCASRAGRRAMRSRSPEASPARSRMLSHRTSHGRAEPIEDITDRQAEKFGGIIAD